MLLAHPGGLVGGKEILSILGGPLLYLIGTILFKHAIRGFFQLSHLVGIGLFIALIPFASRLHTAVARGSRSSDSDDGRSVGGDLAGIRLASVW